MAPTGQRRKIGDEALKAKTGKTWSEWCAILDKAGARKMSHREMVAYLHQHQGLESWWQQMVTVGYEQARGLRKVHEKPEGFEISSSKTLNVPVARVFAAWEDARQRRRWLKPPELIIRKATPNKSLRITWSDGKTNVIVDLYTKGAGKSMVSVQHSRLADGKAAERRKVYWAAQLSRLKQFLEA